MINVHQASETRRISDRLDTVIIGGGQAGLATGYHLRQRGVPFVILDANDRIGDPWRKRWDSLRLFTPARYSGLPGMPFPGSPGSYPTRNEVANYLEAYAQDFDLPVRTKTRVDRLSRNGHGFQVRCGNDTWITENVVIATGAYDVPRIPSFASDLDQSIVQLHSKEYQNPSQLREGGVLVVGAGNSGAEISLELSRHHTTWLSGRDTGQEPSLKAGSLLDRLVKSIMWFAATQVLRVTTPLGRKLRDHYVEPPRGVPLGRIRRKEFAAAGIKRVPRTKGVRDGYPLLENGQILDVANVIWCTGFTCNYDWIDLSLPIRNGLPLHDRGVVESIPGLYFMGLLFLYSLSSALIGGVGRDAAHVVDHIASRRR